MTFNLKGKERDICNQLDVVNQRYHEDKIISIIEHNNGHSNYIISSIIDVCIKNNFGICLVTFLHPVNHYYHTGVKFGHNLKQSQEKGQVKVIDFVTQLRDKLLNNSKIILENDNELILDIFKMIKCSVEEICKKYNRIFIIIDDISLLLTFNTNLNEINSLTHYLTMLPAEIKKINNECKCSLLLSTHMEDEDKDSVKISANLQHLSIANVHVTSVRHSVNFNI